MKQLLIFPIFICLYISVNNTDSKARFRNSFNKADSCFTEQYKEIEKQLIDGRIIFIKDYD